MTSLKEAENREFDKLEKTPGMHVRMNQMSDRWRLVFKNDNEEPYARDQQEVKIESTSSHE